MSAPPAGARPGDAALLRLEAVSAGREGSPAAVHDVSLDVVPGEILAVTSLDDSGAKSTLLLAAAGLLEPRRGRVLFAGEDVAAMSWAREQRLRERVGVVLDGGALLQNRSIWDNVALPLRYHRGLGRRELAVRVERLLRLAGFDEDARRMPWQVSARGAHLAGFARALARDPELVIVDRFFAGLEMPDWRRLFEVVLELNRAERTTWLLASEVDPVIFQVADRVAVLDRGRLRACGTRAVVYDDRGVRDAFLASDAASLRRKSERWAQLRTPVFEAGGLDDPQETLDLDGVLPGARAGARRAAPGDDDLEATFVPGVEAWRARALADGETTLDATRVDATQPEATRVDDTRVDAVGPGEPRGEVAAFGASPGGAATRPPHEDPDRTPPPGALTAVAPGGAATPRAPAPRADEDPDRTPPPGALAAVAAPGETDAAAAAPAEGEPPPGTVTGLQIRFLSRHGDGSGTGHAAPTPAPAEEAAPGRPPTAAWEREILAAALGGSPASGDPAVGEAPASPPAADAGEEPGS